MIDINQLPDFVHDALQNPSLQSSEQFQSWLRENEEHMILFQELCDIQEAGRRLLPEINPDINTAWERVKTKHLKTESHACESNIRRMGIITGIAASIAVIFIIGYHLLTNTTQLPVEAAEVHFTDIPAKKDATIVIKAVSNTRPVLLSTEKGKTTSIYKKLLDYTQNNPNPIPELLTLTTPRGKSIRIRLKDSTEVCLNGESRLSYPSYFTGPDRTVELEGEAYFKVAPDKSHPFIVRHHGTMTQALGTQFNIRSYTNEKKHVTLVEGSVLVSDTLSSQEQILYPGQDVEYDSPSEMVVREVNLREFTAWTEDLFYFEQTELRDIMQILGRWYNVTVAFEDKEMEHYHFTFWAERTGSLKEALSLLNQIGTVKAYINEKDNQVVIKKR